MPPRRTMPCWLHVGAAHGLRWAWGRCGCRVPGPCPARHTSRTLLVQIRRPCQRLKQGPPRLPDPMPVSTSMPATSGKRTKHLRTPWPWRESLPHLLPIPRLLSVLLPESTNRLPRLTQQLRLKALPRDLLTLRPARASPMTPWLREAPSQDTRPGQTTCRWRAGAASPGWTTRTGCPSRCCPPSPNPRRYRIRTCHRRSAGSGCARRWTDAVAAAWPRRARTRCSGVDARSRPAGC